MVSAPFADFTWRHARQVAGADGAEPDETAAAHALDDLLRRAGAGPASGGGSGRGSGGRIAARTRAAVTTHRPPIQPVELEEDSAEDFGEDEGVDSQETGTVIPFGVFDARAEAERWP
jgi:hypothetical protein